VNLIGEHIDYAGLSVLPAALDRSIRILLSVRTDSQVRLETADPGFRPFTLDLSEPIQRAEDGAWSNYPRSALAHLSDKLSRGFDGLVTSDLPPAAGLSSSSALVVATGIAALASEGVIPSPPFGQTQAIRDLDGALAFAGEMAAAERFTGTMGGGMDQAASIGGEAGAAVLIGFDPLSLQGIPIPPTWAFVIADSRVAAEKSGPARDAYNSRREAALEAIARIAPGARYSDLVRRPDLGALLDSAAKELPDTLARRFRHVLTEGHRVTAAVSALQADDPDRFGELMSESHRSLRDDYEVSHAALDELVEIGVAHGAKGARLTGAGFGGSVVILTERASASSLIAALDRDFYDKQSPSRLPADRFTAVPGAGASLRRLL
jgi:galactokinase